MEDLKAIEQFIGHSQKRAILSGLRGEERAFFREKMRETVDRIATMPETYGQDGMGDDAIAHLHYFAGGQANWYITERDSDPDGEGQVQAFGLADLFGDGGEVGYISIVEILDAGGELDLYFQPRPLKAIRDRTRSA